LDKTNAHEIVHDGKSVVNQLVPYELRGKL